MKKIITTISIINPSPIQVFLILIGFILIDFIWLRSLAKLGISYGPIKTTGILFSFLRIGFFVFWIFLQLVLHRGAHNFSHLFLWSFVVPNLFILGFGLYGFYIEPFILTESHVEIRIPGLLHTQRIIQLSDIHIERLTRRERSLPGFVDKFHPDMIVITGDLINESYINNPQTIEDLRELMGDLHAPLGVYAVNGNVETPQRLQMMLQGVDVRIMQNEVIRIPEFGNNFVLVGLNFVDLATDAEELKSLMPQIKPTDFSLLLYHKPDLIYTASDLNVDFYLAGHTHGGQFRLPFYGAIFANSIYGKTFEMGLYHIKNTTLFVSRGLGFTGGIAPRIRFLAPPEIVIIDLIPE
jgi:uncharacterized protein